MTESSSRYAGRGVSASKSEVHKAIKGLDKGLYPNAFCKILPDFLTKDEAYCNIIHADTAGTKPSLAYLYWKETKNPEIWHDIVQDAMVMNIDDMACVGLTTDFVLSSTIGRNKHYITGDVVAALIQGSQKFLNTMKAHGVDIHHGGGETADVGDIVKTVDVGFTLFARAKREDLIVNDIKPGQVIVGFASYGQAKWEHKYNSGIGSNGLTSARHDVLSKYYAETYPESYDKNIPQDLVYSGSKRLTDTYTHSGIDYVVGDLLLSPTRTFVPLLKQIIEQHGGAIKGIIHNTGGAHTKCSKFCDDVHIIKDNLLPVPPVFDLIKEESGTSDKEMYTVFNMGTRLEIYVDDRATADALIRLANESDIDAQVVGRVEEGGKQVSISTGDGKLLKLL